LRLIQSNIWCGKLKHRLIDFVAAERPDIICMQDVNDLPGPPGPLFASLEELRAAGQFTASDLAATYSYNYMNRQLNYGNAVLARLPVVSHDSLFTNGAYKAGYDRVTDDNNARVLQRVTLAAPGGGQFHVLNYHGYHDHASKGGGPITLQHTRVIADYIKQLEGPVILAGDFNLAPETESIAVLDAVLTNLSTKHGLTNTYNRLNNQQVVCDYIFVNDLVKVNHFNAADPLISDHLPLFLDFDV
jgi:endonuclease/exonuclease/phosphatase family metal-dependent hydrolase